MSHDRPTVTPDQLTVDTATLVGEQPDLIGLAAADMTIRTTAVANLVRLLRNTVESRGYRLVADSTSISSNVDPETSIRSGTLTAEATRDTEVTLREQFVPESVRLLTGLLATTAGLVTLALADADFAVITLVLASLAVASPYADSRSAATVTYPVQLELSMTSQPAGAADLADLPSVPSDSRFVGRPKPSTVTVDVASYAPFEGVPEVALRADVSAVFDALREFNDA